MASKCSAIVNEARKRNLWIYDPSYKRWYTPEEFLHTFEHYAQPDESFYIQLQIRHPSEGINAGFQVMRDTNNKLQQFTKRVIDYYKKQ